MKQIGVLSAVVVGATLVLPRLVASQTAPTIPPSITTPDRVETRIGTLDFRDGAPSKATLDKVYDDIDFAHAQRVFADTLQGVSLHAIRKGLQSVDVKDNEAIIFSELMDAKSLWQRETLLQPRPEAGLPRRVPAPAPGPCASACPDVGSKDARPRN